MEITDGTEGWKGNENSVDDVFQNAVDDVVPSIAGLNLAVDLIQDAKNDVMGRKDAMVAMDWQRKSLMMSSH